MNPLLFLAPLGLFFLARGKSSTPTNAASGAMPVALQDEMMAVMRELGVDGAGNVHGPVSAAAIQHATDLSARLESSGWGQAAASIRSFADAAIRAVPAPKPKVAIPGLTTVQMSDVQKTMDLERDPKKLEALEAQLKKVPASPGRDQALGALDSMINQLETQHAVARAAVDVDQMIRTSPASAPAAPGALLRAGSKGPEVLAWQNFLVSQGFKLTPDGAFGPATTLATKTWQKKVGLPTDGVVGPASRATASRGPTAAAASPVAVRPTASRTTATATAPVPSAAVSRTLRAGMKGDDVKSWQKVLADAGYTMQIDGIFGPGTTAATKDWQTKHALPADGVVGPATRAKIGTAPNAPVMLPATPVPQPLPSAKSSREVAADAMATHLIALQKKYGAKAAKGKEDKTLVKRFQREVGMPEDGLPGPGTMLAAAQAGVGTLPKVVYWNKGATKAVTLQKYKNDLRAVAQKARALGLGTLAAQIEASADAEDGSSGGIS